MTLEEWCSIWRASGKWEQRGSRRGQYVMCRTNDEGPYAPWNVRIDTGANNSREVKRKAPLRRDPQRRAYFTRDLKAYAAELRSERESWGRPRKRVSTSELITQWVNDTNK
jgi:hypothetical protein